MPHTPTAVSKARSDSLLRLLKAVLSWIQPYCQGRQGPVLLDLERNKFVDHWSTMLPYEREHVLDLLLQAYCRLARGGPAAVNWNELTYVELMSEAGTRDVQVLVKQYLADLKGSFDEVARACRAAGPRQLASFEEWKDALFKEAGSAGINKLKIERLDDLMFQAVPRALNAAVAQVPQRLAEGCMPADFLPTPDQDFSAAHAASQSSEDRFEIFAGFLDDFRNLTHHHRASSRRGSFADPRLGALDPHARSMLDVGAHDAAVAAWRRLPVREQVHAVDQGRRVRSSACEAHAHERPVATLEDFRVPLPQAFASQHSATTDESLAHGRARISDYYARRHYGTTAREWGEAWARR